MRLEQPPHDLPANVWFRRWRHFAYFWRRKESRRMRRHIRRALADGSWKQWPLIDLTLYHARRVALPCTLVAGIALGYATSQGYQARDQGLVPARRFQTTPAATPTPFAGKPWRDERCELEPMQSPPVIWLADWRNEVRALSGMTDKTRTRGAYASDYGEPRHYRRR